MKIESNLIHFVFFTNVTKIVSQRAQRAERAEPSHFTQRAGPGRAEKSRPVHTTSANYIRILHFNYNYCLW